MLNHELEIFSAHMKELRKEHRLTQKQMSELLRVTEGHYQKIEYGNVNLSSTDLMFLANYFDVSLDYLVGRCNDPASHKR